MTNNIPSTSMHSGNSDVPATHLVNKVATLLNQSIIAQSAELARQGNFTAAEELLLPLVEQEPSHMALDLLARIKAQQGKYESARQLWEKAILISPECPDCKAGLERIRLMHQPRSYNLVGKVTVQTLLMLCSISLIITIFFQVGQIKRSVASFQMPTLIPEENSLPLELSDALTQQEIQQRKIMDQLQANQTDLQEISMQIDRLELTPPSPTPTPTSQVDILDEIKIDVLGVNQSVQGDKLLLKFEDGLFLYNWLLNESGRSTLEQVGYQLEPWAGKLDIQVIGFSDDHEKDNVDFPYFRSTAVIRFLVDNTQLPERIFSIGTSVDQPAPYPNDTLENRSRNRTVILVIRMKHIQE